MVSKRAPGPIGVNQKQPFLTRLTNLHTTKSNVTRTQQSAQQANVSTSSVNLPQFVGRVTYRNTRNGTDLAPVFATRVRMIELSLSRRQRYSYNGRGTGLGSPYGYTLSDLTMTFDNMSNQWNLQSGYYSFLGGRIFLDLELTVYALDEARSKPRCLQMIMGHEMLHVNDEVEIATQTLPSLLLKKPFIISDFRAPIIERNFGLRIRGSGTGRGSELEQAIQRSVWVYESGRKAGALHQRHPNHAGEIERCISL